MLTIIYGVIAISGGALLSAAGHLLSPVIPLLIGLFFLPIVMLTALRQYSLPTALLLWAGTCAVTVMLAPSVGWGVLMAAVWFASAAILRIGGDVTIDLFSLLF